MAVFNAKQTFLLALLGVVVLAALVDAGKQRKSKNEQELESWGAKKLRRDKVISSRHHLADELSEWNPKQMAVKSVDDGWLETRDAGSGDSDDTDESGEPEESEEEGEGSGEPTATQLPVTSRPPSTSQPTVRPPSTSEPSVRPPVARTCGVPAISPAVTVRVVGGVEATPHSWPWQVSLQGDGSHFCGGSLINEQWVLSAAHCVAGFDRSSRHEVVLGLHNRRSPESTSQRIAVTTIIPNAKYGRPPRDSSNDIMLLKLERPVTLTDSISTPCLPSQFQPIAHGRRCFSTGWGTLQSGGSSPDVLMQVMLPIIDMEVCNQPSWYGGEIDDSMLCAGYETGGRDTCQGDSGGPLVCHENDRWVLYGVVSWGYGCARALKPGVYARVSPYIKWMNEKMAENSLVV